MTSKFLALKKANRARMAFVSETSRSQIKEVVRYLKRVSWDFCGIELIYSDLIDIAIDANKQGQELFNVITDAETFVNGVKNELNDLTLFDYFLVIAPPFFFWEWGIEGLVLLVTVPQFQFELSLGVSDTVYSLSDFSLCSIETNSGKGRISSEQPPDKICGRHGRVCSGVVYDRPLAPQPFWKHCVRTFLSSGFNSKQPSDRVRVLFCPFPSL